MTHPFSHRLKSRLGADLESIRRTVPAYGKTRRRGVRIVLVHNVAAAQMRRSVLVGSGGVSDPPGATDLIGCRTVERAINQRARVFRPRPYTRYIAHFPFRLLSFCPVSASRKLLSQKPLTQHRFGCPLHRCARRDSPYGELPAAATVASAPSTTVVSGLTLTPRTPSQPT